MLQLAKTAKSTSFAGKALWHPEHRQRRPDTHGILDQLTIGPLVATLLKKLGAAAAAAAVVTEEWSRGRLPAAQVLKCHDNS